MPPLRRFHVCLAAALCGAVSATSLSAAEPERLNVLLIGVDDLKPTLAELAGLPLPKGIEGRSFAALLDDPAAAHRDHAIHVYPRGKHFGRAIRTAHHRLVEWRPVGGDSEEIDWELYRRPARDPSRSEAADPRR